MQSIIETKIDQTNNQGKNQRSHQYQYGTALQFIEFRPRDLISDLVNRIEDIVFQFFHLIYSARVERLELPANGFGDRYSTN